jgi:hypothetical protein
LDFVKNCGIESETDFVLIQTFWQFWMGNDPNHYAFPHIIGYQTRYPFNAIAHLKLCHSILRFPKVGILIRLTFVGMLFASVLLANPLLTYRAVGYVPMQPLIFQSFNMLQLGRTLAIST